MHPANPQSPPAISVVIPAYNERARLGPTLEAVREYAAAAGGFREVVVVDDGSLDGTSGIVRNQGEIQLRLLTNDTNRGKGFAVRRGMLEANGELLLLCDADQSAPIGEIEKLLPWVQRGFDVVIGSRDLPDSRLEPPQPFFRRILAWMFRAMRRRLLLPEIRDTQCGFKLFTREAARSVFERATVDGWLFDCEVLALAERLGYRIKEVGVTWRNHPASHVRPLREALRAIPTLLSIRRRVRGASRDAMSA